MKLKDRQRLFMSNLALLLPRIVAQGCTMRGSDFLRSTDQLQIPDTDKTYSYQELLFFNGKTKVKYGKHNDRLALDLIIERDGVELTPDEYRPFGEYWESLGGAWGGRFGIKKEEYATKIGWDANHFEGL